MKFKLLQETLYLTIRILDRYLSMADIQRGRPYFITNLCIVYLFKKPLEKGEHPQPDHPNLRTPNLRTPNLRILFCFNYELFYHDRLKF